MMETDARSTSSFPYDDIDEAAEAQPLTSQAATAGASRDIHEDALNKSDGKFRTSPISSFSHFFQTPIQIFSH